jgi:hypothetical protein
MSRLVGTIEMPGRGRGKEVELTAERRNEIRLAASRSAARRNSRWREIKQEDLELRRRRVIDKSTGLVYSRVNFQVFASDGTTFLNDESSVAAFYISKTGEVIFLEQPGVRPQTVAELDREETKRKERAARAGNATASREQRLLAGQSLEPLTLSDVVGKPLPTLSEAARIVETFGAINAKDGRVVIELPPKFAGRGAAVDAAKVLLHERETVLTALGRRTAKKPLSELLPDRPACP